ncbi:sulfotransferase family protein [Chloroflexi bacterium TSY]|nr:sulfotransferase family protein [Chloroflexi bacterium TSY]
MMQGVYHAIHRIPFLPSAGRYNLSISHDKKFIWFRVAKVGTQTIYRLDFKRNKITLDAEYAYSMRYPSNLYRDYFKFAFVRNPWDRLVSYWQFRVFRYPRDDFSEAELEQMKDFRNFVDYVADFEVETCRDIHIRLQSALIDLNEIDYLGRMETFDDDAHKIFHHLGIKSRDLVPENVNPDKRPYQEFYDTHLVEKVGQIYQKDIQLFGYRF